MWNIYSYMLMHRAAVHNLDAEFTILEMTTSNAFSFSLAQDFVPFHTCFYLANVSNEINFFRAGGELCLRLQFRTRSDRQHELCNYLTFCWYSGLCFENLEKLSRLHKSLQNYLACKDAN